MNMFICPRDGLLALDFAHAIADRLELATGPGETLYAYEDGLWRRTGEQAVRRIAIDLLGNRYRGSHCRTALDVLTAKSPKVNDEDADTEYLNLPNGLLDWRTGELHEHTSKVFSLNRIPVKWNPDATCPRILEWLLEAIPEDCFELVEELFGYCLYNGLPIQKAILLYGAGGNGKGTLIRLVRALTGDANCSAVTPQGLDTNRFAAQQLYGKLVNAAGDVDPATFSCTEVFKQMTGGDALQAEAKYSQPFQFVNRAVMIASFNVLPRSTDTSDGFFRRWIVLPMVGQFRGKEDQGAEDRMHTQDELEGLLVMAVRGLQRLMQRGRFQEPKSAEDALSGFKRHADPVRQYMIERLTGDAKAWVNRSQVHHDFKVWCEEQGYKGLVAQTFYDRVLHASSDLFGVEASQVKRGVWGLKGVRFQTPEEAAADSEHSEGNNEGHSDPEVALFPSNP